MKKLVSLSTLAAALLLSGCKGDEEARQYAKGLMDVLQTYQEQLEAKSAGEQKSYKALANIYGESADHDLLASLNTERRERGDRVADLAMAGKTPTGVAIEEELKEYASHDSESTHELLTRESNNYDKYLSTLNKLAVDADAIDAATEALRALTKKPTLIEDIGFLKEYGTAAKGCLSESICKDLADRLKAAQGNLSDPTKALTDAEQEKNRKAALSATISSLQARRKSAGCAANPTCPVDAGGKPASK